MNAERWQRLQELFEAGVVLDEASRGELLRAECQSDPELAAQVQALWQQQEQAGEFLERPAAQLQLRVFQVGQVIADRFELLEFLGSGGMGEVHRAKDKRLGRMVAIKVLTGQFVENSHLRQRLEREARAISSLAHPRICTLYDLDWESDLPFLVMEYLEGETLATRLHRGRLDSAELLTYAIQIAEGLASAHQHGIIHRDLKPANIMLTDSGVKILDFGLAKQVAVLAESRGLTLDQSQTGEGAIIGTVAYMSPEQAEGKNVDARSDVFSLGAVLYEMASGQRAFQGDSTVGTLTAVLKEEPQPLRRLVPTTPPELDSIIRRCLHKDPAKRYSGGVEVATCLRKLTQPGGVFRFRRWAAVTMLVLALGIAGGFAYSRVKPRRTPRLSAPIQLTYDQGITREPALSPDGKFVAYVSDRGDPKRSNLWIQQVQGTESLQLSRQCLVAAEPVFTPDAAHVIYYCQQNDLSGLFRVPVLGGEPQLVVRDARFPAVSPDGKWIAYWTHSQLGLAPLAGGVPRRLAPQFVAFGRPVWMPDSDHVLFVGSDGNGGLHHDEPRHDVWVASVSGTELKQTGILDVLRQLGMSLSMFSRQTSPVLLGWEADGARVLLSFYSGDAANVWAIPLSTVDWTVTGEPEQITSGFSKRTSGSAAAGLLAFDVHVVNNEICVLPILGNGLAVGQSFRVGRSGATRSVPIFAPDGKSAMFISGRARSNSLLRLDLTSGREVKLADLGAFPSVIALSRDGTEIAFDTIRREGGGVQRMAITGGRHERITERWGTPTDWLPDKSGVIVSHYDNPRLSAVHVYDFKPPRQWVALRSPNQAVFLARISPDGRWLAFRVFLRRSANYLTGGDSRLYVAPFRRGSSIPENEWIPITEGIGFHEWSADGRIVYELRYNLDRTQSVYAHQLDDKTKQPFSKSLLYQTKNPYPAIFGFSASAGRLLLLEVQPSSNVWLMNLSADRQTP